MKELLIALCDKLVGILLVFLFVGLLGIIILVVCVAIDYNKKQEKRK